MAMTPKDVVKLARDNNVKMIDFRFIDLPGTWQHYSIPVHRLTEALFEENMVLNLEGGPSRIGLGAHSLENTYRITRNGFERWSSDDGVIVEV